MSQTKGACTRRTAPSRDERRVPETKGAFPKRKGDVYISEDLLNLSEVDVNTNVHFLELSEVDVYISVHLLKLSEVDVYTSVHLLKL